MPRPYYGWFDQRKNEWRLSLYPPDAPVRPSLAFETRIGLMDYARNRRSEVHWYPALTTAQLHDYTTQRDW